ncbi:hypothetical protein GPJ56_004086 [Histomonas meleagridis]|uniref:uncharacterized protein n=1 Tax=Histomonas meleagridis TaxID=135588 RepID=UPI003559CF19|nr:hypothetical protein GPJ56_004086 [Histomonas meleagridis]KAH0799483.1 hypothetical protein GO595_007738 [Histomonas meleagridis]
MNGAQPQTESFETLSDAISYVFKQEQTSLLSLDRICEVLSSPDLFIKNKKRVVSCASIPRRRISSTLSSSDLFVRAGPPRTCLWAICPHNPLYVSDGAIAASIEQMLASNGPMTLEELVNTTELTSADVQLFERFLSTNATEFTLLDNGKYWFTNQPVPTQHDFESISNALVFAFHAFPQGASVEELHWYLCLSTVSQTKPITRRCVSRELSRRQDLFLHLSRARYTLIEHTKNPVVQETKETPAPNNSSAPFNFVIPQIFPQNLNDSIVQKDFQTPINGFDQPFSNPFDFQESKLHQEVQNDDEDYFDPVNFFGNDFQFSFD